jgi:hypothetical protein
MKMNAGQDKNYAVLVGMAPIGVGIQTATASSATSITGTGTPFTASAYVGQHVIASGAVLTYGVITANTTSVITVDRWYNPAAPNGAAIGPPGATDKFFVMPGAAGVPYMALTVNATAPAATDTVLTGEITTAGGGLIRQLCAYAHTTGANTYTLTGTFTANGSDSLGGGVIVAKIGTFDSLVQPGVMFHETLLPSTATLTAVGDQLTVTQTVTM